MVNYELNHKSVRLVDKSIEWIPGKVLLIKLFLLMETKCRQCYQLISLMVNDSSLPEKSIKFDRGSEE